MTQPNGSADTGSPEGGNGNGGEGSNANVSEFLSGLDEGSRGWIEANGIKADDPAALLSGVVTKSREMESLIGSSIKVPGKDASAEDVQSFYDKATERLLPKEANGYEYTVPENMPENVPYDSEFADAWREFSFESKLPPALSAKAHDWFVENAVKAQEANKAATDEAYEGIVLKASEAIKAEWGAPDSETHKTGMEHFHKAIQGLGGDALKAELQELGAIDEHNQVVAPNIILALSKVGKQLFAEDSLITGEHADKNPFADDTKDWGKQNAIIRDDPNLAKQLIKAAGKDPKTYRL
ncbi:hypothetical protein [Hoeflea sp. TYP-13]|uniref:hypothetical protein n=1 Tax=Hoeflea sp. TYP-13 TaxID=3230023 RepID=UPI0034C6A2C6